MVGSRRDHQPRDPSKLSTPALSRIAATSGSGPLSEHAHCDRQSRTPDRDIGGYCPPNPPAWRLATGDHVEEDTTWAIDVLDEFLSALVAYVVSPPLAEDPTYAKGSPMWRDVGARQLTRSPRWSPPATPPSCSKSLASARSTRQLSSRPGPTQTVSVPKGTAARIGDRLTCPTDSVPVRVANSRRGCR